MEATGYLNAADPMPEEVISDQDFPHRLALSGIWELPFGQGKQWLNRRGLLERFAGGWQVQGVYQAQSGRALDSGTLYLMESSGRHAAAQRAQRRPLVPDGMKLVF